MFVGLRPAYLMSFETSMQAKQVLCFNNSKISGEDLASKIAPCLPESAVCYCSHFMLEVCVLFLF